MTLLNKVAIAIVVLLGSLASEAVAGTTHEEPTEYQVKAAFLFNFVRFVEWPPPGNGVNDPLVIGIFGKNPFGDALDQLVSGKSVNGRPLIVRRISDASGLRSCNLVFFPASDARRFGEVAATLANLTVLTVGESDGFATRGGMINFVVKGGRVLFEANPAAAARSHLKISSKVLQLAMIVKDGAQLR